MDLPEEMLDAALMPDQQIGELIAQIVAAYVGHHQIEGSAIPGLIRSVRSALSGLGIAAAEPEQPPEPAVPIRRSVFPDYIVCLEDGKKLKMLRRHLQAVYGMTPEEYRDKWKLPQGYPMTAPNYAARRSELAKSSGLGRKPASTKEAEPAVQRIPEGRSGMRGKKA